MTSRFERCVAAKTSAGTVDKDQAQLVLDGFQAHIAAGDDAAAASLKATASAVAEARRAREVAALRVLKFRDVLERVEAHEQGFFRGAMATLSRDLAQEDMGGNVIARSRAVANQAFALMADFMAAYRAKNLGLARDVQSLRKVVDEIYGTSSGDAAAAAAARAWDKAEKFLVERFNAAGGDIKARDRYIPFRFERAKVAALGKFAFEDFMHGARNRGDVVIRDFETGLPVDDLKAAEIISNAFDNIRTEGMAAHTPGAFKGSGAVANRHREGLVFEWASAKAWHEANERLGVGDGGLFDLFVGHVQNRAREIAQLEILGPNPAWAVRALIDIGRKKEALTDWQAHRIEAAWEVATGAAATPVNEAFAHAMNGIRAWQTSARLLSATLSAVSDWGYMALTARMNDMSAAKVMARYLALLDPAKAADRALAARQGLIVESWLRRANGALREGLDEQVHGWLGATADFLMRLSGLNAHTDAGRAAFGLEFLGHMADLAARKFEKLPGRTLRQFERYGIDADMWDLMRTKGVRTENGVAFMSPEQLARGGKEELEASTRLLEMVLTEMDFAVPTPGGAEKAMLFAAMGRARPGSPLGELGRSALQFKTFPVTVMTTHLVRALKEMGEGRGGYLAGMVVATTVLGALAMQLKAIANGKDPRDMADWKFWGAAYFQGGGAGIVTDFIYSATTRSDMSFYMQMFGGPVGGAVSDLAKLTFGNVGQAGTGKNTHFGRELARFVAGNTPGSSLWYTRLGMQRLVWDQIQMGIDPDYARAFRRMEQTMFRETGQEFFWRPGESRPARAPEFGRTRAP